MLPSEPDIVVLCLYRNDLLDNGQADSVGIYRPCAMQGEGW
ncbi:MAG: hypothetical protein R3E97_04740 [Candidatus Eisenbacteria bacterium]